MSDWQLHQMWLATSCGGGAAIRHQLLRCIDDRRANESRWTEALETHPGPMLFLWGPADAVSGAHVLPRIRERIPRAIVALLDGEPATGHYPQIENPAGVIALLIPSLTSGLPPTSRVPNLHEKNT